MNNEIGHAINNGEVSELVSYKPINDNFQNNHNFIKDFTPVSVEYNGTLSINNDKEHSSTVEISCPEYPHYKKSKKLNLIVNEYAIKIHKPIKRGLRAYINSRLALNESFDPDSSSSKNEINKEDNTATTSRNSYNISRTSSISTISSAERYDEDDYDTSAELTEYYTSSLPYINDNVNHILRRRYSDGDEYIRVKAHDLRNSIRTSSELQSNLESYFQLQNARHSVDSRMSCYYDPETGVMRCPVCDMEQNETAAEERWRSGVSNSSSKYVYPTEIEYLPKDRIVILCNVICLGLAFMVLSTAFGGTVDLQNTLNNTLGLGAMSLMSLYIINLVSNLCLPPIVIRWLGCKRTVAVCFLAYIPFIVAQFDASYYTLIPGAVLIGIALGPIYCAACTYLKILAKLVAGDSDVEPFLVRFLSIFYMFAGLSNVWGSIITTLVLTEKIVYNETIKETVDKLCGASFCPNYEMNKDDPMLQPAAPDELNLIVKIYLSCTVIAFFIVLFGVSSLNRYKNDSSQVIGWELLLSTLKLLKNRNQLLLIPINIWMGMQNAFIEVEFSESFVTCALGLEQVGPVIICYGLTTALVAIVFGSVVPRVGRIAIVCLASTLQIAILIILFTWTPGQSTYPVFFVISILWAITGGTWLIHLNALSGVLFPGQEEESFSQYRIWEAVGFIIETGLSGSVCVEQKLYLQLAALIIGTISYIVLEILESKYSGEYVVQGVDTKA